LLLGAGAEVNLKCNVGSTSLIKASRLGHIHVVRLLLEARAEVDMEDNNGRCALSHARKGLLLEARAEVNLEDNNGRCALSHGRKGGHAGVARLLLDARAAGRECVNPVDGAKPEDASGGADAAEGAAARDRGTAYFKRGEFKSAAEVLPTRGVTPSGSVAVTPG